MPLDNDFLIYISDDGKSPRRPIDKSAAPGVTAAEFRRAVLEGTPGAKGLSPDAAHLQHVVLLSISHAADFAYRLSRMTAGGDFRGRFLGLRDACRAAAAAVYEREEDLAAIRTWRGLAPLPAWAAPSCTSATQAVAFVAMDIQREISQAALDVQAKATKARPHGRFVGRNVRRVVVPCSGRAFDKEVARRFNREFYFPPPAVLLTELRLEVMGLSMADKAVVAPTPAPALLPDGREQPAPPTIYYHGGRSYSADGKHPREVNNERHNMLAAFLDVNQALGTAALANRGVSNVSRVANELAALFGAAVRIPKGDKGAGYSIRVRSACERPHKET